MSAKNFGSYETLDLRFESNGLTLIKGDTGSGKSTVFDLPLWTLYGTSPKNIAVDDVIGWEEGTTESTATIEVTNSILNVTRIRSKERHKNDFFWEENGTEYRGKDLRDTQRLFNERTGVSFDQLLMLTYLGEFSSIGSFFYASNKEKRAVFEQITDLSFVCRFSDKLTEFNKITKTSISDLEGRLSKLIGSKEQLQNFLRDSNIQIDKWYIENQKKIISLSKKSDSFSSYKIQNLNKLESLVWGFKQSQAKKQEPLIDKLDDISQKMLQCSNELAELKKVLHKEPNTCPTCGAFNNKQREIDSKIREHSAYQDQFNSISSEIKKLQDAINPYIEQLNTAKRSKNTYEDALKQQLKEQNPFQDQAKELLIKLEICCTHSDNIEKELEGLKAKLKASVHLKELVSSLRSCMISNNVDFIQDRINYYLTKYFDSLFSVQFIIDSSENLDVILQKGVHSCSYGQLSKGQRQLLRLLFSVSVVDHINLHNNTHINFINLDEPCDGFDSTMKIKAYSFFQELLTKYEDVLIVDHTPEFQELFDNKISISLYNNKSVISYD